jgi:predicted RNA binding protein YcfA (HicA-like mRNA interferase family)
MRVYTYRRLVRALKDHDRNFYVDKRGGKGSHRMLCHANLEGRYPLPWHGDDTVIGRRLLREIVELFALPPDLLE